jgi:hypothetical protein
MKLITRELYQKMQEFPRPLDVDSEWRRRCDEYHEYWKAIRDRLPPGMREFLEQTLHDGVVRSVVRENPTVFEVVVDAIRNPWGRRGIFRLRFLGVREVDGIEKLLGDDWLYEEVHLHEGGKFEYRVLFWKSDFRIVADEV